jgi:hypothetical protein
MKIDTKYGPLDEEHLTKVEREVGGQHVTSYYILVGQDKEPGRTDQELVHRSAVIGLTGLQAAGIAKA